MPKLVAVAVAAALLLLPRTAAAHTNAELDAWMTTWGYQSLTEGLTPYSLAEYDDMGNRHPRYFGLPVPHSHAARATQMSNGVEQWRPLIATYFRPGDVDRALRIMACESGGNPSAANSLSNARGLMQHLGKYWARRSAAAGFAGASIFDPTANVATAAWLRDQPGGWLHWVCK